RKLELRENIRDLRAAGPGIAVLRREVGAAYRIGIAAGAVIDRVLPIVDSGGDARAACGQRLPERARECDRSHLLIRIGELDQIVPRVVDRLLGRRETERIQRLAAPAERRDDGFGFGGRRLEGAERALEVVAPLIPAHLPDDARFV